VNNITNSVISTFLERLELGAPATDEGLTLIPVFGQFAGLPEFVTLQEAIASGALVISEVSRGGSVPSLRAHNAGSVGVLILDGEELAGAKQNRVLNTSVYIKPGQEIVIPVSCTEAGRWAYRTGNFADSGYVSAGAIRMMVNKTVTENVRSRRGFDSDQRGVWDEIGMLQERHNLFSPTSAAREVYERRGEAVRRREAAFPCAPGQIGIVAFWLKRVAGLDVVTSPEAYSKVHTRLVRSYALDAPFGKSRPADDEARVAREWLSALAKARVTEHESPGNGLSYRFTGDRVIGSALAVDGAVLHAVAFATGTVSVDEEGSDEEVSNPDERYPGFFERRERFPW
jgi:ARG and Rhodanese-Phosphatase-superfamily-associated Protein domain